jgi:hypothetical protein
MCVTSSANGNRTRISALRGQRPEPLDDSARFFFPPITILN